MSEINYYNVRGGATALHLASGNDHAKCVKLLIGAGAQLNIQDTYGWTALHSASVNGHTECVKLLIGARVNKCILTTKDWRFHKAGSRAIDIARKEEHTEIVRVHGGNKNPISNAYVFKA